MESKFKTSLSKGKIAQHKYSSCVILFTVHVDSHACPTGARVNTIVSPPGGFFTNAEIEQVSLGD